MRNNRLLLSVVFGLLVIGIGSFSISDVYGALDSKGTEFIIAFNANTNTNRGTLQLHITSDFSTQATINYPVINPSFTTTVNVNPGQITIVEIPQSAQIWNFGQPDDNAVKVTAPQEVTVYSANIASATSDAGLALPTDALSFKYIITSWLGCCSISFDQFTVVATKDNTSITINPTANLNSGQQSNTPFIINLNKGQGFSVRTTSTSGDLSGSIITADKPIGVTNGNACINVPIGTAACDATYEHAIPVQGWGNSVLVADVPQRPGSIYRVFASEDNTKISLDGTSVANLNEGQFYQSNVLGGGHVFSGDKPIFVVQFLTGINYPGATNGDPAMANIVPTKQYLNSYTFSTVGGNQFNQHFLTIVAANSDLNSLKLDGSVIGSGSFTPIPGTSFSSTSMFLTQGTHTTSSPNGHGILVGGYNSADSYLYPGGAAFEFINPQPEDDRDGDGVLDINDECPDEFAQTENGCPASSCTDNFDDNLINESLWNSFFDGEIPPTLEEANNRLEISFASNSTGANIIAGNANSLPLNGDFDITVDYELLTWPENSGVRIAIVSGIGAVERVGFGIGDFDGNENYVTHIGNAITLQPTSDLSGKLRLERVGDILTGYYFNGTWIEIDSQTVSEGETTFSLQAWSHDYAFGNKEVKIAFDNLEIKGVACESPEPEVRKKNGGDNQWDTRPTFGISHEDRQNQVVENGFRFNNNEFTLTDNHWTPFEEQSVEIGTVNSFSATVYADKQLKIQEFLFGIPNIGEAEKAELGVEVWYDFNGEIQDVKVIQKSDVIDADTISVSHEKVKCLSTDSEEKCDTTTVSMKFLEPLKDKVMAIKAIDFKNRDQRTFLNEGFDISGKSLNPMQSKMIPSNTRDAGLIQVTQLEKYSPYWVADDGRMFEMNNFGSFKQINQKFERFQDKGNAFTRMHSGFGGIIEYEKNRASQVFDASMYISELPDSFGHHIVIHDRMTEELKQNMLQQEQIAKGILEQMDKQTRHN